MEREEPQPPSDPLTKGSHTIIISETTRRTGPLIPAECSLVSKQKGSGLQPLTCASVHHGNIQTVPLTLISSG